MGIERIRDRWIIRDENEQTVLVIQVTEENNGYLLFLQTYNQYSDWYENNYDEAVKVPLSFKVLDHLIEALNDLMKSTYS